MTKGILISFEGGEGSGKTTQIQLLDTHLQQSGLNPVMLREPGGTPIGEEIRNIVLDPNYKEMAFATEVFLFQAQRAQLYQEVILPALQKGQIVLIDRTRDSSVIYQGMVRRFGREFIEEMNMISTQNTYPKITFLLDLPIKLGLNRKAHSGVQNRLDREQQEFHQQVREAYVAVAEENAGGRWHIVDATQTQKTVSDEVWQIVKTELL